MEVIRWLRLKWAWHQWFFAMHPALDPRVRPFLPKDSAARRKTLRVMHDRWKAKEPVWETFK